MCVWREKKNETASPNEKSKGLEVHNENQAKNKNGLLISDDFGLRSPVIQKNHFRQKKVYLYRSTRPFPHQRFWVNTRIPSFRKTIFAKKRYTSIVARVLFHTNDFGSTQGSRRSEKKAVSDETRTRSPLIVAPCQSGEAGEKFLRKFLRNFLTKFLRKFLRKLLRKFMRKFTRKFLRKFTCELLTGGPRQYLNPKHDFSREAVQLFAWIPTNRFTMRPLIVPQTLFFFSTRATIEVIKVYAFFWRKGFLNAVGGAGLSSTLLAPHSRHTSWRKKKTLRIRLVGKKIRSREWVDPTSSENNSPLFFSSFLAAYYYKKNENTLQLRDRRFCRNSYYCC